MSNITNEIFIHSRKLLFLLRRVLRLPKRKDIKFYDKWFSRLHVPEIEVCRYGSLILYKEVNSYEGEFQGSNSP